MARHKMFVISAKACRELGYKPRPAEQALREAVDYFRGVWRAHSAQGRMSKLRAGAA
jgi:nucleoside-diphosphate-sugar epimerase